MSDVIRTTMRQRGQITLPAEVRRSLGIKPGDAVVLEVQDGSVIVTPSRQRALDALSAIQEAFQRSGVAESDLQASGRRIRKDLVRGRYGPER